MLSKRKKILISINTTWNLYNFRAGLIRALIDAGFEVVAVAPPDDYIPKLLGLGCRYVPLPMDNKGSHPGRDLLLFWRFLGLMRAERPDVYLGYTVKPNVYGSLAAQACGIPVINNIAGLGAVFIKRSWLTRVVMVLYRLALKRSARVLFQNEDDRQTFIDEALVRADSTDTVPGSGIDLARFSPRPRGAGPFRFLLVARLLWDKGVGEFVDAARKLKALNPSAEFCLLGFLDVQNPAAIKRAEVKAWEAEGVIRYLGVAEDVREHLARADCVVLPSYREGTPRSLLEAAAMARPVVTTDAVGCRDVVEDGDNGYLCRLRDADDLAEKMRRVLELTDAERAEMGRLGRAKMEREFDEAIVIEKYLGAIRASVTLAAAPPRRAR